MHVVDLDDTTNENLEEFKDFLRGVAGGKKITNDIAVNEALLIALEMSKDESFLDGFTQEFTSRLKAFREENK